VLAAVKFARTHEVLVSVRGGGHNAPGNAVCQGGLMIDLAGMRSVRVDPLRRTARAEGGATWGDFDRETQAFGLATTGGSVSDTGIAGLTLGGGLGWLAGKYGLSCDNLLSVDLVTAEGKLLIASASENADLFWGRRGGGRQLRRGHLLRIPAPFRWHGPGRDAALSVQQGKGSPQPLPRFFRQHSR